MKTIKSMANIILTIAAALLVLQVLLALMVNFLPASQMTNLQNLGVKISGQAGLVNVLVLLIRNGLWVFGLAQLKIFIKNFQVSDLMTEAFANFIKKAGIFVLTTEVFSSYLATLQAPAGTYLLSLKYGVTLILLGFACDYSGRYLAKHGFSL